MSTIKCMHCRQEILEGDLILQKERPDNGVCPLCFGDIPLGDELSDAISDLDGLSEKIVDEWGIDELTASMIVEKNTQSELDRFMFITNEGFVYNSTDEYGLKLEMLDYFVEFEGSIADIKYVFIDGSSRHLEVDIKFTIPDEDEDLTIEEMADTLENDGWPRT